MKTGSDTTLAAVERRIGYRFKNKRRLATALTHASAIADNGAAANESYQRLEFLGDRVLGQEVTQPEGSPSPPGGNVPRGEAKLHRTIRALDQGGPRTEVPGREGAVQMKDGSIPSADPREGAEPLVALLGPHPKIAGRSRPRDRGNEEEQ